MPIYAYKCASCGHAKDVLQKLSDAPLTVCPACGAESFGKQVTAAGFQLKGSGWYATDFKGSGAAPAPDKPADPAKPAESGADTKADSKPDTKADTKADAPAKTAESPSPGKSGPPSAADGPGPC